MRKIMALNIAMAVLIFGGMLFVAMDFAFNITGKLNAGEQDTGPMIVEADAQRELMLPLAPGEELLDIQAAGDQVLIHVGRPGENGRIMIVSAISAKHRATINLVPPPDPEQSIETTSPPSGD